LPWTLLPYRRTRWSVGGGEDIMIVAVSRAAAAEERMTGLYLRRRYQIRDSAEPAYVYLRHGLYAPAIAARAEMVDFARRALEEDATPVFLAYSLGKGQEVMATLARAEIPVAAHGSVWNVCAAYRLFGHKFPGSRKLTGKGARRAAIVVPPRWLNTSEVQSAKPLRIAAVTGWGARAEGGAA
jgi:hypothetical protein